MADIELVIKIDEGIAKGIIDGENDTPRHIVQGFQSTIADTIKHGTPLPKGHGDLIDVNDLLDKIGLEDNNNNRENNVGEIITLEDFDFIPIIIEAESEE